MLALLKQTAEKPRKLVLALAALFQKRGNVDFVKNVFVDDYVRHDLRPTQAAPGAAGQALIASYGVAKYHQALFVPDAGQDEKNLHP